MTPERIKELRAFQSAWPPQSQPALRFKIVSECLDAIESQAAQLARQSEQIDALIKRGNGLARYLRHAKECEYVTKADEVGAIVFCTCGLNELLSAGDGTETAPPLKSPADS